ncbi:probable rhamnogalacturonate lyase B [Impatiens glandulifera]|uniref:probable rhamnogalacturonate lyase B n=1 Tax=Impatiens glandulifera TaxID=253017 RepID=UPI001FB1989C|nr:probable rhamnogalacturonate lyase B [Impatiens glandulifera]
MSNGLVSVTFSSPDGAITAINFGDSTENVLNINNKIDDRGYWDVFWSSGDDNNIKEDVSLVDETSTSNVERPKYRIEGTSFKIIVQKEDQVEISFNRPWDRKAGAPLNVDMRFIMLRGSSGFYSYGVFERLNNFPMSRIDQIRIVFKLREDLFDYMAISDQIQKVMPSSEDRAKGEVLSYKEAVRLKNGEVDDKYEYSLDNKDNRVHGWVNRKNGVGFWIITPSNEFRNGGPIKRDLTSHCGPLALSMFVSTHYIGLPQAMHFKNNEPWKKVFGPVFTYLNSNPQTQSLWVDAKKQMKKETSAWPYNFPLSPDFAVSNKRGSVSGRLVIKLFLNYINIYSASAHVGLAEPGDAGSWQYESKLYQFWTEGDVQGNFIIEGVRPGNYTLFAWVPGFIGDYKYGPIVTISPGSNTLLNNLSYAPPRTGNTLWEIGYPDRTASEFNVPEPNPRYANKLSDNPLDRYRQYGLWSRYSEIYPREDLVYTVGTSNYSNDWFFAHVTRNSPPGSNIFVSTTWKIVFGLEKIEKEKNYTLRLAIAGAGAPRSELQVRVNNNGSAPLFTTGLIGGENLIARHGIHGLYRLYNVLFRGKELLVGKNVIYLTQSSGESPFRGIMYDYIRLEGPSIK